jgi:hypothetical protein
LDDTVDFVNVFKKEKKRIRRKDETARALNMAGAAPFSLKNQS